MSWVGLNAETTVERKEDLSLQDKSCQLRNPLNCSLSQSRKVHMVIGSNRASEVQRALDSNLMEPEGF